MKEKFRLDTSREELTISVKIDRFEPADLDERVLVGIAKHIATLRKYNMFHGHFALDVESPYEELTGKKTRINVEFKFNEYLKEEED